MLGCPPAGLMGYIRVRDRLFTLHYFWKCIYNAPRFLEFDVIIETPDKAFGGVVSALGVIKGSN